MVNKQSAVKPAPLAASLSMQCVVAMFLVPGLVGFFLFFILPFCVSLYYAFLSKPLGGTFVGFSNFAALFNSRAYVRGLFNTLRFIGLSVPLNMGLSLGVALLINKLSKERRELCSLFFLIPLVIPSGSLVFFWKTLFAYDGALNGMLHALGIGKVNWLDSSLALVVMTLIFIWKNLGYNMVLFLAGLGNISKDYYEAAAMDGVGFHQSFIHITVPCLMPSFVLALIMSIVNSFKVFREIYLITGSYPHESIYTLQHFMNNQFASLNYPRLCSAATILVLIILLFTQALLRLERKAAIGL
ncbi:MAG: sugar ABC transporter permease [Treponema sp.]|nr:sugar ABC transporter permease [Treponema sp.]